MNIYNNFFPLFVDCYSACLKGRILQCSFALQFCNLVFKYSLGYSFATSISGCQLGSERVSTIYTAQKTNKAMLKLSPLLVGSLWKGPVAFQQKMGSLSGISGMGH